MNRRLACRCCVGVVLCLSALAALADERLTVCFNYGCLTQAEVVFDEAQWAEIGALLGAAGTAEAERAALAVAAGRLLGWAGQQSPIGADRGGNYADDGVYGRMDCVDHATTTTRLLQLIERGGLLRFHRVLAPVRRTRFLLFEHNSARIEEIDAATSEGDDAASAYVVDSWFFDNGRPAVVMPLTAWSRGEGPHDGQ